MTNYEWVVANTAIRWNGWSEYREYWNGFVREWFECKVQKALELPNNALTQELGRFFAPGL